MESPEKFLQQLADAARSMQGKTSTQETLDEAVQIAIEIIDGCDLAGMSIINPRGIDTPAGSGDALRRLDSLQFELKEGPCFDALQSQEMVLAATWQPTLGGPRGDHSSRGRSASGAS